MSRVPRGSSRDRFALLSGQKENENGNGWGGIECRTERCFLTVGPWKQEAEERTAGPLPWQMLFVWILNALQRTGAKGLVASLWHCREVLEPLGGWV